MPEIDFAILSAYLDHELTVEQRRVVDDHIKFYPDWREKFNGLHQVKSIVSSLQGVTAPQDLIAKLLKMAKQVDPKPRTPLLPKIALLPS